MLRAVGFSLFVAGVFITSVSVALADARAGGAIFHTAGLSAAANPDEPGLLPAADPAVAASSRLVATPRPTPVAAPLAPESVAVQPPAPVAVPTPATTPQVVAALTPPVTPAPAAAPTPAATSEPTAVPIPTVVPTPAVEATPAAPPAPTPAPLIPTPAPPAQPHLEVLAQSVNQVVTQSAGRVSVSVVELGGPVPQTWSLNGSTQMTAASTYKLPALMDEAALIAAGRVTARDQLCYTPDQWEDGWFSDYQDGACFSRADIAYRAAHFSDNTAGHMLVRDLGGAGALNAFARADGASASSYFNGNTTTSDDLAQLWAAEARGQIGGAAAQSWLYPLLTHTAFEQGIPAGVPASATVVHKTGQLDPLVADAALVMGSRNGPYVIVVMTDGPGGDEGWALTSRISAAVWQYEQTR